MTECVPDGGGMPIRDRGADAERLRRLYNALRRVNRAIVHQRSREDLFREVCHAAVEQAGFRMSWVGWYDAEHDTISPIAHHGDIAGYLEGLCICVGTLPQGAGPAATAFKSGKACISNDFLRDPTASFWRDRADARGLRSAAVLPIRCQERVCGVFAVYGGEIDYFQAEEIALLEEAAADISFGLDNFESQQTRRRAEEYAVRFAAIVESTNDAILSKTADGIISSWNPAAERMFGYGAAEIIGSNISVLIPAERRHEEPDILSRIARGERIVDFETVRLSKSGHPIPVSVTISPIHSASGAIIGASKIVRDMTARKLAEAALLDAQSRFRVVAEHLDEGLLISDVGGTTLDWNPAARSILGLTAADPYPRTPEEFFELMEMRALDGSVLPPERRPLNRIIHGEELRNAEYRIRRRDRDWERTLAYSGSIVHYRQGRALAFVVFRDITERHRAAQALREANAQLENRVRERTSELAVAKDRAESADRLKSAFLATMSHELRTPLNSIIGFTGIVLQQMAGPLNEEQAKQLGMVRGSARHLLALINDVLDISKIEAGEMALSMEEFDLDAAVCGLVDGLRPMASRKNLELRIEMPIPVGRIRSDQRRLEQVLINLLNNAIKFTDHGEVRIAVSRGGGVSPSITFRVIDTGIGIAESDLGALFQPFRQIDSGLTRQHEGTGLGLAICRKLAELLGGSVCAQSRVGLGSEFTLTLPLTRPADPPGP